MADVKFLSTDEVAAILNLDKKTVQRMCKEGRITAVKQSDRKQSWWKIPEKAIGYCKICGKPFPITKERRVYCSDECVLEAKRAKSLAYWRKTHPPKAMVPDPEPEECECEQLCMDLPEPLPFEPDPEQLLTREEIQRVMKKFQETMHNFCEGLRIMSEAFTNMARAFEKVDDQ